MVNMKRNVLLVPFVAVMTLLALSLVSAGELANDVETRFNDVILGSSVTMTGDVADTVPVRVTFDARADMDDVRVKVYMEGHREEISTRTSRFDIVNGKTYTKLLTLDLPSDSDELSEEYTLYVEIVSKNDKTEEEYTVSMQRTSYTLEILSVDYSSEVSAGDMFPVSIVAKNNGFNRADDVYVVASIPALGVSTRGYAGDLVSTECYSDDDADCEDDEEDSVYKTVYLKVPANAPEGVYDIEFEVYNEDAKVSAKNLISVGGSAESMVLAAVKNKDVSAGETVDYELIIVNSADDVKVYTIDAVSGDDLTVSVPTVVTVGPDASETVTISVTADSEAELGTYTFSVNVDGSETVFGANVTSETVTTSVVALTVVLVIIFVVLLAVLIVLLTRKEKPIEEVETSYY